MLTRVAKPDYDVVLPLKSAYRSSEIRNLQYCILNTVLYELYCIRNILLRIQNSTVFLGYLKFGREEVTVNFGSLALILDPRH